MDVLGGGERQLLAYAQHLKQFGIQADLYDMWNTNLDDYDVFHCFSTMPGTIEMCSYAKQKGLKLVVSPNLWVTEATKDNYPFNTIWNSLEVADRIMVNSNAEAIELSRVYGMHYDKFAVIYNGAEPDFTHPVNQSMFKEKYSLDRPYVLNVANVEPRKNQLEFIKALKRQQPEMDFVIVGGIRDKEYASKCIEEGGNRVKIVGSLEYASEMMRSAYAGCSFFAMPSLLETPSIAAIEASATGARVLLTEIGSTKEYFGDSVTYVNPDSQESLQKGIADVMNAQVEDSTLVVQNNYLWPVITRQLADFYLKLL